MTRLIGTGEVEATVSYRTLGLVDEACVSDTYTPDMPEDRWLWAAPGMVYLQCPSAVVSVRVRLESWTTAPPSDAAPWSGTEDTDVDLPSGVLGVFTFDGRWQELAAPLPSPGLYGFRLHWAFNPERAPFYSPLRSDRHVLETAVGREQELAGVDQYCLVQAWRLSAA
ncbi:hypothetical protein [Streptomyces sp. URMC 123]|uniref:hypothetical protein n=1 Tax=Streptomyces sp. URMC 123 TaxID=3423403 RepID=UPI003F1E1B97